MTSTRPWKADPPDTQPELEPRPATRSAPEEPTGASAWAPWSSIAALFAGLVVTVVGSAIVAIASGTSGELDDPPPGLNIALTLFQNLALVGAAMLFAYILAGRPRAADFGLLRPPSIRRAIGLILGVWFGFYALSALWVTALGLHETQELPDRLGADNSTVNLLAVVVLITVVAPIGEEMFFRGYFFGALRNWKGVWPAAIGTGVIFGAHPRRARRRPASSCRSASSASGSACSTTTAARCTPASRCTR